MRPRALTIAGTDPSGGAGIAQDLRSLEAMGVWGMCAVTAVTVQDTTGVVSWHAVPADVVAAQIETVLADSPAQAAKTGMLPQAATVEAVASALRSARQPNVVVDPVLVATSGDALASGTLDAMRTLLIPMATVVTPNTDEARALTDVAIDGVADQAEAARRLVALGATAALVTGGHLTGDEVVDVLVVGGVVHELRGPRVTLPATHGTGCALSAAIAAGLALGDGIVEAVERARAQVRRGLEQAMRIGRGAPVVDPGGAAGRSS